MQLQNKYFPYPVIVEGEGYYIESSFGNEVEQELEGYNIKLIIKTKLVNDEMNKLVNEGKMEIVHHIECPQTCFRDKVCTRNEIVEYLLEDKKVNGNVQICSFIVAKEDIAKYTNELFSPDYQGFKFDIEKGCIMAIASQINLRVSKIRDDLADATSIFSIGPNQDKTSKTIVTDLNNNKIVILLPEETYSTYVNMQAYMDVQPVLHSMIIVPVLMYTLGELKQYRKELYQYEDNRWFRSMKKAGERIGIKIDAKSLVNLNTYEVAQLFLDCPIVKAVEHLAIGGDSYED
jgi:hypothetical protein